MEEEVEDRSTTPASAAGTSATYRITEADYVRAMQLHARMGRWQLAALAVLLLALAAGAVLGPAPLRPAFVGGLAGAAIVVAGGRWGVLPWLARRHYRRYRMIHEPFTVQLRDDGVRFASPQGDGLLLWTHILKWRSGPHDLLLYPMPRLFHIVPRAVAARGFDLDALTARLEAEVGAAS